MAALLFGAFEEISQAHLFSALSLKKIGKKKGELILLDNEQLHAGIYREFHQHNCARYKRDCYKEAKKTTCVPAELSFLPLQTGRQCMQNAFFGAAAQRQSS
mgnify:CR=1 FL=1